MSTEHSEALPECIGRPLPPFWMPPQLSMMERQRLLGRFPSKGTLPEAVSNLATTYSAPNVLNMIGNVDTTTWE